MKIVFIGGGSVQWTPKLVTDIALTETLTGADLVLHDIDGDALDLLAHVSRRIAEQAGSTLSISATLDRAEALRGADFVVLCVGIGGLAAMRNDLEIPERYGVYQSVGDTVGPGGLSRGLRHIPFAVQVAREMEALCPQAYLLNLTNPMTTICRGVTRATSIRTIGLCHEVTDVCLCLGGVIEVPVDTITLDVAGINHLPVILRFDVGGRDGRHDGGQDGGQNGLALLRDWLGEHDPFTFASGVEFNNVFDVFIDRMAVKLTLFEQLGVLFGAGDRHVVEFLPGFLTEASDLGRRYGVLLTAADHREEMARARRAQVDFMVATGPGRLAHSEEQLAPVMAALSGGPPGRFVVNVPNQGQVNNLPHEAVVECIAYIDAMGVRPLAVGDLPYPAYVVIAPHVARQELIVEAALTGRREPALAALATDPLVVDPTTVEPMFDELWSANQAFSAV